MDGRMGRLHCRYRVISAPAAGALAAARLNRVAQGELAEACARSLDQILGADPAVWIVRSVSVKMVLHARPGWDDAALARQWGARVAGAAVQEIAQGVDHGNVMRFEDQADLVARFIGDLLRDEAWGRWFYGCFARYRDWPAADAVLAVLLENREHIPAILARLNRSAALEPFLVRLDRGALEQIWTRGVDACASATEDEIRPLFAAALRLSEDAGGADRPPNPMAERWLREYVESGPSPPDWRDRSGLTLAVAGALEFLWKRGYLRPGVANIAEAWRTQRKRASHEFDWLDMELLDAALERFTAGVEPRPGGEAAELPLRPDGTTPRRQRLMTDLAEAIAAGLPELSLAELDAPAAALRIYARLVSRRQDWAGDPLATQAIQGLLATADWIAAPATHSDWMETALAALEEKAGPDGMLVRQIHEALREGRPDPAPLAAAVEQALAPSADVLRLCLLVPLRFGHPTGSRAVMGATRRLLENAGVEGAGKASLPRVAGSVWLEQAIAALERLGAPEAIPRQFLRTFGEAGLDLAAAVAAGSAAAKAERLAELRTGVETQCAGVFLLIRAMLDAKLASIAHRAGYPLAPCILALGLCWGGKAAVFHGRLDAGIGLLSGQGADMTLDELRTIWGQVDPSSHARFQAGLLGLLAARGILGESTLEVHRLALPDGRSAIVCGGADSGLWPLVRIVEDEKGEQAAVAAMVEAWREATGAEPVLAQAPEDAGTALREALDELGTDYLQLFLADFTLALTAGSLLRLWAGWLRQFSSSSIPYLLRSFIRRPGRIVQTKDGLLVEMAPRPLDIVIEMSGYVSPLHAHSEPWECGVAFKVQGS